MCSTHKIIQSSIGDAHAFQIKKSAHTPPFGKAVGTFILIHRSKLGIILILFKELTEERLCSLAKLDRLECSADTLDLYLEPSVVALGILLIVVNKYIGNEVADLARLEVLGLCPIPAEVLSIRLMEHIPKLALSIAPKKVEYLVAATCGEI